MSRGCCGDLQGTTILHNSVFSLPPKTQLISTACFCRKGIAYPESNDSLSIHKDVLSESLTPQGYQIPASALPADLK